MIGNKIPLFYIIFLILINFFILPLKITFKFNIQNCTPILSLSVICKISIDTIRKLPDDSYCYSDIEIRKWNCRLSLKVEGGKPSFSRILKETEVYKILEIATFSTNSESKRVFHEFWKSPCFPRIPKLTVFSTNYEINRVFHEFRK